ncbi:MAG: DUF3127 domain-containing protein [Ignavibacteriaceae bacterium]|jgi:hypothetical protein|nr:DUF3127 domain-containing protein [Ignavibacteriaceae bacterium]
MNQIVRLVQLNPVQTGEGKNGPWKKQEVIVETEGQYPRKICVLVWGDKIDINRFKPGDMIDVYFDVESREYNGKWYTDAKAWKIEPAGQSGAIDGEYSAPAQTRTYTPATPPPPPLPLPEDKDLPF